MIVTINSILSAALYRMGGMGKPFRTWMRDWVIPLIGALTLFFQLGKETFLGIAWYWHLLAYLLFAGALTTYWDDSDNPIMDWISRKINWMYPKDNLILHGFFCALAYICYAIPTGLWFAFFIRLIRCTIIIGLVNLVINKIKFFPYTVWIEEPLRGFILIYTLKLFG